MNRGFLSFIFISVVNLCIISSVKAENFLQNLFFTYENDSVLFPTDRYYSNGLQLSLLTKNYKKDHFYFYNYSFGLGQKIFTASDIKIENPDLSDHPYAGYLYVYFNKNYFIKNNTINLLGLSLGITGEASFGEFIQKDVHEKIGSDKPRGWHSQLDNELLFMGSWLNIKELYKENVFNNKEVSILSKSLINLGTPYTNLKQYVEFRYGLDTFSDFSFNSIDNATVGVLNKGYDFNFNLFLAFGIGAVFYNTFLDGNLNDRRKEVNKNFFVYELNYGVNFIFNDLFLKLSGTFMSKEFKNQENGQSTVVITFGWLF